MTQEEIAAKEYPARPTYSKDLNRWMRHTLFYKPSNRYLARKLLDRMVPEAEAILRRMAGEAGLFDMKMTSN